MEEHHPERPRAELPQDPFEEHFKALGSTRLFHVVETTLKRPAQIVHEPFFNPAAFSGNFYEYLWHSLVGGI